MKTLSFWSIRLYLFGALGSYNNLYLLRINDTQEQISRKESCWRDTEMCDKISQVDRKVAPGIDESRVL